jgi:quercetin dioxygenase-like cupin family protein
MPSGRCRLLSGGDVAVLLKAPVWRAFHVWRGAVWVKSGAARAECVLAGQAVAVGREPVVITPEAGEACQYWLWELDGDAARPDDPAAGLVELLRHDFERYPEEPAGAANAACVRLERVDLHLGAQTPRHTHAGCGLRVLISGALRAQIGARRLLLAPGDAWLERGPGEPVIGEADPDQPTAFLRLMILPDGMEGQDSFRLWDNAATTRQRPATYQRFFEQRVIL